MMGTSPREELEALRLEIREAMYCADTSAELGDWDQHQRELDRISRLDDQVRQFLALHPELSAQ